MNELIAYGAVGQLWTMNPDGSGQKALEPEVRGGYPSWSADRTKLLYVSDGGLGVVNADGSNARFLIRAGGAHYMSPKWSPDGREIALVRLAGQSGTWVEIASADGSGVVPIPNTEGADGVTWMRDGSGVVFCQRCHVYRIRVNGTEKQQITAGAGEFRVDLSHDGGRIAYACAAVSGKFYSGLCVANSDGSNPRVIYTNALGGIDCPNWSPDGTSIVFQNWDGTDLALARINPNGQALTQLATPRYGGFTPDW
jgi:Tol biopolymer transport system component